MCVCVKDEFCSRINDAVCGHQPITSEVYLTYDNLYFTMNGSITTTSE